MLFLCTIKHARADFSLLFPFVSLLLHPYGGDENMIGVFFTVYLF